MNILIERGIIDMKQKLTLLLALLLVLSLTGLASLAESEGGLSEPGVLPIWTGGRTLCAHRADRGERLCFRL